MGYRVIEKHDIDIYEPETKPILSKEKFSLDKINISTSELWTIVVSGIIGLLFIWVGATNAGSYYMPGTRLGGMLFTFFYTWQMGTVFIVIGVLILYHTIFGSGRKWI